VRGLYAITPDEADTGRLLAKVEAALGAGIAALQYRNKAAPPSLRREQAQALLAMCRARGVPLIINDDVPLAAELDADGVHVGREDGGVAAARRALPGKRLGASCYDSLALARAAVEDGADHVAFGSVFASDTKPAAGRAPLGLFALARELGVPLVAIGGITLQNTPQLIAAGADCVAVISDLFGARDIATRAAGYRQLFQLTEKHSA
jgi:thiamine-phosphate pyrophosphorylase